MDDRPKPFRVDDGPEGPELRLRLRELGTVGGVVGGILVVGFAAWALVEANPWSRAASAPRLPPSLAAASVAPALPRQPVPVSPSLAPPVIAMSAAEPPAGARDGGEAGEDAEPEGDRIVVKRGAEPLAPGAIVFSGASNPPARPLSERRVRNLFRSPLGGEPADEDDSFEGLEEGPGWKVFLADGGTALSEIEPKVEGDFLVYRSPGARRNSSVPVADVDLGLTLHPANRFRGRQNRA